MCFLNAIINSVFCLRFVLFFILYAIGLETVNYISQFNIKTKTNKLQILLDVESLLGYIQDFTKKIRNLLKATVETVLYLPRALAMNLFLKNCFQNKNLLHSLILYAID